jgi:lysophospholipase
VFINGRTEWIEKNMELPELLQLPEDCGFLTWDQRGQGASGGARAFVRHYDDYVFDARKIIEEVIGNMPYAILAHSMGGLVAMYGCLSGELRPSRMALCSPLFQLPQEPVPSVLAYPIAKLFSNIGLSHLRTGAGSHHKAEFARNKLTHDYQMYRLICESPYRIPSASFGWINETFKACNEIFRNDRISSLSAPTLVLTPEFEEVVDPKGHHSWVTRAKKLAKVDVELSLIHGGRHELLSETLTIRDRAILEIRRWFKDFLRTQD